MPDPNQRDAEEIQYMSEAYGKERELEVALQTDIAMTTKQPYKKRLQEHLRGPKRTPRRSTAGSRNSVAGTRPFRAWSAKRPRWRKARCTSSAATASRRSC